ncbi:MAG: hypothetical protein ACTSSA_13950, partial [Candidatus Freyarchaeota archaeon]
MGALQITYAEAKQLTLDYLRDWMSKLPAAQRNAPVIMFDWRSWSIPQMIAQVQNNTDVGKRFVYYYIGSLKRYVITG